MPEDLRSQTDERIQDWLAGRKGKQVHISDITPWRDMMHRRYFFCSGQRRKGPVSRCPCTAVSQAWPLGQNQSKFPWRASRHHRACHSACHASGQGLRHHQLDFPRRRFLRAACFAPHVWHEGQDAPAHLPDNRKRIQTHTEERFQTKVGWGGGPYLRVLPTSWSGPQWRPRYCRIL